MNGSRPFVYQFRLLSRPTGTFYRPETPQVTPTVQPLQWDKVTADRIRSIQDNLTRPKGLLWAVIWFTGFLVFFSNLITLINDDYYYDSEIFITFAITVIGPGKIGRAHV